MTTRLDAARAEAKTADCRYASGTVTGRWDADKDGSKPATCPRNLEVQFLKIMRPGLTWHQLMHCGSGRTIVGKSGPQSLLC